MLESKNNKHHTYYRCTYLYIVNAVICKLLLTSHLKHDFLAKNNDNITTLICLAISVRARFCTIRLFNILRSEFIWQYWWTCCFSKGWGNTETLSKLFANHNTLGQLTNHNTFRFSEGGPSSNPELIESFVSVWGERYYNNVNNVTNNAIFEPQSMRACSSTPPKTISRLCKRA